ncbi:hypothetical protein [Microbacterium sp. TNHR37B]|uniref:hypothetical protein n=1 Tax=Microbacterium sp. TNHR37B TaxID=1775956 RepID=UPI000A5D74B1
MTTTNQTLPAETAASAPRAIVTASDSGIGAATAIALAESGMDVGITWHTDEEGARRRSPSTRWPRARSPRP